MKIYNYDRVTGEYLSESTATPSPLEPGMFLIPACATTIEPPLLEHAKVPVFDGAAWQMLPDFRGFDAWDKATGAKVDIVVIGDFPDELTLLSLDEFDFPVFVDGAWEEDEAKKRSAAEKAIRLKYDAQLAALGHPYLENEQKSWGVQESDAIAWTADNDAPAPYLRGLATRRGVPVSIMAAKIIENANLFRAESVKILGDQQKELDELDA